MLKRMIAVSLVLMIAAPVLAQTVVPHNTNMVTGWRGGNNHSTSYSWLDAWPNTGSWGGYQDATLAQFDRAALQTAINSAIDTYGGWDAKVLVTQPDWVSTVDPKTAFPGLQPVVGSAQVDAAAIDWTGITATSFSGGLGSWALGGTVYSTFGAAVLAGVTTGQSVVYDTLSWTTEFRSPWYDVVMDAPENVVVQYMKNTSATGLFASAKAAYNAALIIYQNQNGASDLRVRIDAPPTGAPWINAVINSDPHALWVSRTIVVGASAVTVPVQVNNARTGTLAWTAAESPDATWLTLNNASGGNGATFQMVLNATGMSAGTYSTSVVITDNNSANKTVTIPVTLTVQSASPVIQLVPTSLLFQASPSGANPTAQSVTVNNVGSGTLSWTAAENPDVAWMSISPTTGGNGGTFTVSINKTGLAAGSYTGTIRVTDAGASNSPQNVAVTLNIQDQDANVTTANSYDDAWQTGPTGWIAAMQAVRAGRPAGVTATSGFCVFLGDSITYSSAFGAWARGGSGKTAADTAICNWSHAGTGSGTTNITNDGWWLAKYDYPGRNGSFTARSGITAAMYVAGLTYPDLPGINQMFTAGFTNPDAGGKQYRDAEIAVILLGTNDLGGYTDVQLAANLSTMVDKLEADGIIPVLTTIPPAPGQDAKVLTFVTAVRNLAQTRKLPLIDFYQEIMRRRPGQTWQGTLIGSGDVHPTGDRAGFTVSSDPYANNGQALSEVGYLLRTWLTVQKIAEIKTAVIDAPVPPAAPSNPSPINSQIDLPLSTTLSWTEATPGVTFDVYLDTVNPPVNRVATGLSTTTCTPTLAAGTRYYWKVVAINGGAQTAGSVWTFATHIPADIDSDGYVNVNDLEIFVVGWASQAGPPASGNWIPEADLNNDGYVNVGDLQILVANWGKSV